MDTTTLAIIGGTIVIAIGASYAYYTYKKKNMDTFFEEAYEVSKQVPKQKKNSFLLLMFMEAVTTSKKDLKSKAHEKKLNNPKYLEVQLIKMSKILKDGPDGQDKKTKQALNLLKSYQTWEKNKNSSDNQSK